MTKGRYYACKTINVAELLQNDGGLDIVWRIRKEIGIMSLLAGHPNVSPGLSEGAWHSPYQWFGRGHRPNRLTSFRLNEPTVAHVTLPPDPLSQVVQLCDVFTTATHMYLIQELCTGGTLADLLLQAAGPMSEAQAAPLFRGVVESVLHCHQQGILHRNVKPTNFLLSTNTPNQIVKLADFGLSCFNRRGVPEGEAVVGSPYYMAPEMVTPGSGGYGPPADLFSCGVVLYRILTGNFPFPGNTTAEIFNALRHKEPNYTGSPAWLSVSQSARHLVRRLLEKDPSKRIDAQDVLTHEWMKFSISQPEEAGPASPGSGSSALAPAAAELGAAGAGPAVAVAPPRDQVSSDRILFMPEGERMRMRQQGFLDIFKRLEESHQQLLRAPDAEVAALHWEAASRLLRDLNDYLLEHASRDGPFFMGHEPSIAEAATAPALFRIIANLSAVRHIDLLLAREDSEGAFNLKLARLAAWLANVMAQPANMCDVPYLPLRVYIEMVRKLHVCHEGPPSPSSLGPPILSSLLQVAHSAPPPHTPSRPTKYTSSDSARELNYKPESHIHTASSLARRDSAFGNATI